MQNQKLTTLLQFKILGSDLLSMTVSDSYSTLYANIKDAYIKRHLEEVIPEDGLLGPYIKKKSIIEDRASRIANIIAVKKSFKLFNFLNNLIEVEPLHAVVNLENHSILIYKLPTMAGSTHML